MRPLVHRVRMRPRIISDQSRIARFCRNLQTPTEAQPPHLEPNGGDEPWANSDAGDCTETEAPEDLVLTALLRILATLGLLALALVALLVAAFV